MFSALISMGRPPADPAGPGPPIKDSGHFQTYLGAVPRPQLSRSLGWWVWACCNPSELVLAAARSVTGAGSRAARGRWEQSGRRSCRAVDGGAAVGVRAKRRAAGSGALAR